MRILFDQNARGPGQRIATQDAKTIERNDAGPFCPVHVTMRRVVRLTIRSSREAWCFAAPAGTCARINLCAGCADGRGEQRGRCCGGQAALARAAGRRQLP